MTAGVPRQPMPQLRPAIHEVVIRSGLNGHSIQVNGTDVSRMVGSYSFRHERNHVPIVTLEELVAPIDYEGPALVEVVGAERPPARSDADVIVDFLSAVDTDALEREILNAGGGAQDVSVGRAAVQILAAAARNFLARDDRYVEVDTPAQAEPTRIDFG